MTVAGAILAGGQARRYGGEDKSRLVIGGQTILDRQIAALRPICDAIVVIVNDEARRARYAGAGLPIHVDRIPDKGAIGGIYTALATSAADAVITIACDLPNLPSALLARLAELAAGADAAWVRGPRGPEPLVACYRARARDAVRQQIDRGALKASDLAHVLRIMEMTEAEVDLFGPAARVLANVNTPDEYATIAGGHSPQSAEILSQQLDPSGRPRREK